VAKGEPVPIVVGGASIGTVTVTGWTISPLGQDGERVLATVRYDATSSWRVDPATWIALTGDGDQFPFDTADRNGLKAATLQPGGTETGEVQVDLDNRPKELFIVYETLDGNALVAVALAP
jgi:hypothetical protein